MSSGRSPCSGWGSGPPPTSAGWSVTFRCIPRPADPRNVTDHPNEAGWLAGGAVDPAYDVLDVGLLDRQVTQVRAQGDLREYAGGRGRLGVEPEPLSQPVGLAAEVGRP